MKQFYFAFLFLGFSLFTNAQTPTGNSTEVGITEGQLSVSLTGGATYAIPIAVPPGINGVVPQVGLTYNSQGGNGLAGYGWNISGVSTITRIPATKFHDGTIDAVDFNSMDRFAFDGQRLIVKNGTSTYGADGTVYETENFSNVKITSYGVHPSGANYGPAYFIIEYPDGSKAYYGSTANSRSITNWAIEYWENPQGVRISYTYTLANNNLSITYIKYGSTGTNTPINQIQFVYKARQRPEQAYVGGQSILNNTILSSIAVTGNGVGFRSYLLTHDYTTMGYDRLTKITESSGDGTKSYNPTVFSYGTTNDAITYSPITTNINVNNISSINSATVTGDFNGDGKMDFLVYPTTGTTSKSKYWLFYNLDPLVNPNISYEQNIGAFEEIFATSLLTGDAAAGYKLMPKQGWTVIKNNVTTNTVTFSNYSAEGGISPVFLQYEKSNQFPLFSWGYPAICGNYSSYVTKTYNVPKKFINGDFNGDGLTDLIAIDKEIYYQSACDRTSLRSGGQSYFVNLDKRSATNYVSDAGTIIPSSADKYIVADFNGDGKSDLYVFNYQSVRVYALNDLNQFILLYQNTTADIDILFERPVFMGDYNGDGKSDFIIPKGYGTNYAKYISTGTSFIKTSVTYNIPYIANSGSDCLISNMIIPTDINGDGKTDLITYSTTGCNSNNTGQYWIRVWNNMDSNFVNTATYNTGSISGVKQYALPIFLSSDRPNFSLELAAISDNKIYRFNSQKDFNKERLLQTITTGNGVKESITYSPIVNDPCSYNCKPLYSSSSAIENYPNTDIPVAPSFQVVSKLEKQSATVYKKQLFAYYGAVSNLEGLGFLGFRASMRTNWHDDTSTNPILSTVSKFDVGLRGANIENYSVLYYASPYSSFAPTDYISKSILTYNTPVDALQANKVFKLKNTIAQQYNGLDDTSSETTTIYDSYNNPTAATTYLKNGSTTEQTTMNNVAYDNQPSGTTYYIGRPISKTSSVTSSGDTMTSEELYTYTNHLLTQIKKKGHNTNYITEDNSYDSFGNITKKTISATGLTPRETNYEYDTSGRFLTKSIDVEGLATTYNYNTASGVLNSETNPYGLTTSYLYDSWFKKTKTTDYLGKSNTYSYTRSTEKTIKSVTGDDGSYSEELYDDLGRKITASVKDLNGNTSSVSYLYDIYDRNYKVSEPYSGSSPTQWNETQYDVYGRPTQNISFTGKTTNISYSGLTTTMNDGTKTKIATKNAIGNMVTMNDSPGGTITYTYFANGNLLTTNYDGVVTTIEQDGWGRKTKLIDPSAGTYTYTYNDFGGALTEITPNGTTTYTLNAVGKPTQKTIVGTNTNSTTTYTYDSTTKLPTSSTFVDALENNATTTTAYTYDSNKRLIESEETTPYATFTKQLTYDAFGRLNTETSIASAAGKSSAKTVQHTYKNGQPWQIIDAASSQVLWQTNTVDARGQLTGATMANDNIAVTNTYDSYGFVSQTKQDRLIVSPGNIMTLTTSFDPQKGNLTSRTNSLFNWSESFTYDSLDRLTSFKNTAGVTEAQDYDDRGRITQNAVGTYNYTNTSKAYQNTSVTVTPDALAHYQTNHEQNISYNTFKSPYQIEEVEKDKISFTYNDANSRSAMFYGSLDNNKLLRPLRKYYSADGSMEIKHNIQTGDVEFITYIGGDGYTAPIVLKSDGTTQNYLYLQRDYQGSIVAISDATGQVLEKRLFDAWGNVLVQDGAGNTLSGLTILDRGYTGHEHLQSVGLIHMNGRLYDPKLHRFLQPDNYVQDPNNTQNYNRYGYVLNNPLRYTDPTGENWWDNNWRSVVTVVAAVATAVVIVASMGTATPLVAAAWAGAGAGFVGGTLGTALNGGSFSESLLSGFKGAAFGALSGYLGGAAALAYAPAGAFSGALYGGTTSLTVGSIINTLQGRPTFEGAALNFGLGAIGGGYTGFKAAQAQGLNPWTGAPKTSVIADKITASVDDQISYAKSVAANAEPTKSFNNETSDLLKNMPSDGLKIDIGNQGKHILDHNNYIPGKSILDADAHFLLGRVQSGNVKNIQLINEVKTRIDFGTNIGTYRSFDGAAYQTTKALMIQGKNGIHFVPSRP